MEGLFGLLLNNNLHKDIIGVEDLERRVRLVDELSKDWIELLQERSFHRVDALQVVRQSKVEEDISKELLACKLKGYL